MKGDAPPHQSIRKIRRRGTGGEQAIEHAFRRETAHQRCPLDRIAIPIDRYPSLAQRDRDDAEIDLVSEATIESDFVLTRLPPTVHGGVIDKGEMDWSLDFDHPVSCQ